MKTTDDRTYYSRTGNKKKKFVRDFVSKYPEAKKIFDVGCNNGDMSYPLQKELNKDVYGIDLSKELKTPHDYQMDIVDIMKWDLLYPNDITLFFSLYHHLLAKHGIDEVDDLFYKLLLHTKHLLFDVGNLSEKLRQSQYWYPIQKKYFKNEKDLFDHFGIDYNVLGKWDTGGGTRTVVSFSSSSFDGAIEVVEEYRRLIGSSNSAKGLLEKNSKDPEIYTGAEYKKLKLGNKLFFSKKHKDEDRQKRELKNIEKIYNSSDSSLKNKLIRYYGHSTTYGFIYEWIDDFIYSGKTSIKVPGLTLTDVDIIKVGKNKKYIDFER